MSSSEKWRMIREAHYDKMIMQQELFRSMIKNAEYFESLGPKEAARIKAERICHAAQRLHDLPKKIIRSNDSDPLTPAASQSTASVISTKSPNIQFTKGYHSVRIDGGDWKNLTTNQSRILELLHGRQKLGTPYAQQASLMKEFIRTEFRLNKAEATPS